MNYGDNRKEIDTDWTSEELDLIAENRYARLWMGDASAIKGIIPFETAKEIMGSNFISLDEVEKHFGITNELRQELLAAQFPSCEIMEECADTHMLVPYTGQNILELPEKEAGTENSLLSHEEIWLNGADYLLQRGNPCWLLIRKTPVESSAKRNWKKQLKLIAQTEQVPEAKHLIYAIILFYLVTEEQLFQNIFVRTSSLLLSGKRAIIGNFGVWGVSIDYSSDREKLYNLGLSCLRKF